MEMKTRASFLLSAVIFICAMVSCSGGGDDLPFIPPSNPFAGKSFVDVTVYDYLEVDMMEAYKDGGFLPVIAFDENEATFSAVREGKKIKLGKFFYNYNPVIREVYLTFKGVYKISESAEPELLTSTQDIANYWLYDWFVDFAKVSDSNLAEDIATEEDAINEWATSLSATGCEATEEAVTQLLAAYAKLSLGQTCSTQYEIGSVLSSGFIQLKTKCLYDEGKAWTEQPGGIFFDKESEWGFFSVYPMDAAFGYVARINGENYYAKTINLNSGNVFKDPEDETDTVKIAFSQPTLNEQGERCLTITATPGGAKEFVFRPWSAFFFAALCMYPFY